MAATLVGFTGFAVRADPPSPLPPIPLWDSTFTLRTAAGYKDNALLSHSSPQGSAFQSAAGEFIALRLAPTGPQLTLFGSANADWYYVSPVNHAEYLAFTQARLDQPVGDTVKLSLTGQYLYQDQLLDVSVSETNRRAVAVRGHKLAARPTVKVSLPGDYWVETEGAVVRQFLERPLDDYWEAAGRISFGRDLGRGSELSLAYEPAWRLYDAEPARTVTGTAITGERRQRFEQEARAAWRQYWDDAHHWRSQLTLSALVNTENGGGYFDYTRWLSSGRLTWRQKPWEISAEVRLAYYPYAHQTISVDSLALRRRTDVTASLRVQRELSRHLKVIATYEREQTLSNEPLDTLTANTVSGALEWEF